MMNRDLNFSNMLPIRLAGVLLLLALLTLQLLPGVAWCSEGTEKERPLVAIKSQKLEELLKKGDSVDEYATQVTKETLLSGFAAALESDDPDVRFRAMGYLLTDGAPEDHRLLPFIQELAGRMTDSSRGQETLVVDRHGGNELYRLTKLTAKYPDMKSVPYLLVIARQRPERFGSQTVESPDGEDTGLPEAVNYLDEIAEAIESCTDGKIGRIPEGTLWWQKKARVKLVEEWEAWWEENKPEGTKGED